MTLKCLFCHSNDTVVINTYKHHCIICNDCNNVSHKKKNKYILDYLLPKKLIRNLIPEKAYFRLFSADDFVSSEFYDVYSDEILNLSEWRKCEFNQLKDELAKADIDYKDKSILDISGGPGFLISQLKDHAKEVSVTEYSQKAVDAMKKSLDIDARKFDYNSDSINEVYKDKTFDIILVRSSIIFSENLDSFIRGLNDILNEDGIIFIESILPTYGEIFWWQQLEHKFTFIYSQETIEKLFYKYNFKLILGIRDYGSYYGVKQRSYDSRSKLLFTWLIEYPMLLLYLIPTLFKKAPIDSSLKHKVITMIWKKTNVSKNVIYENYQQGAENKSKTFGYVYNGYLGKN